MKKTKILLPAIGMLLLSTAASVTGTVAWFSANSKVTAKTMTVTAGAPTSLLISTTSATAGFGSSVTLGNDVANPSEKFVPVAYAGKCESFYALTTAAQATVNENGVVAEAIKVADGSAATSFTGAKIGEENAYTTGASYVYHDTVWLKVEGAEDRNITATATYVSSNNTNIKKAMHVVFVVTGTTSTLFDLDMGADTGSGVTSTTLASLTKNADGKQIDIYYFLSGNDSDCKNSNITKDDTLSIDLSFDVVTSA